jgi:hypothetical protein
MDIAFRIVLVALHYDCLHCSVRDRSSSRVRAQNPASLDPQGTRAAMGHTRTISQRVNLARLKPASETASTGYCLADPGVSTSSTSQKAAKTSPSNSQLDPITTNGSIRPRELPTKTARSRHSAIQLHSPRHSCETHCSCSKSSRRRTAGFLTCLPQLRQISRPPSRPYSP